MISSFLLWPYSVNFAIFYLNVIYDTLALYNTTKKIIMHIERFYIITFSHIIANVYLWELYLTSPASI
jgi:hypothetical protein